MSVRRLADEALQPASFSFTAENDVWARRLLGRYPAGRQQSAVIPLLMRAQEQDGWVTRAAIEHVADRLAMPLIRVLEVATFYTQFQLQPIGARAHIQVCGTTPCMLRGAEGLKDVCRSRINREQFRRNESGTLSWEEVECLGACVNAPMVMVFKDTYEDLTPERLSEIIDAFERGEEVRPGPQIERHLSVPVGGPTTLTSFGDDEEVGETTAESTARGSKSGTPTKERARNAPSQAARVDTHAAETDPSIRSPGVRAGAAADIAVEEKASADPDKGAGPGADRRGGTRKGATGADAEEADAERAGVKRSARKAGASFPAAENAAEDAVVSGRARTEDGGGKRTRRRGSAASDDTGTAGPAAKKGGRKPKPVGGDGPESA